MSRPGVDRRSRSTMAAETWRLTEWGPRTLESMCRSFMGSPLVLVCNWRYMSDCPKTPQERTILKPEHSDDTRAQECACRAGRTSRRRQLPRGRLGAGAGRRQMECVRDHDADRRAAAL